MSLPKTFWNFGCPKTPGGEGSTQTVNHLGKDELLGILKTWPCLPQKYLEIHTLFRTKDKMGAVLFLSHLLAIAIEQIHVIVIAFLFMYLE